MNKRTKTFEVAVSRPTSKFYFAMRYSVKALSTHSEESLATMNTISSYRLPTRETKQLMKNNERTSNKAFRTYGSVDMDIDTSGFSLTEQHAKIEICTTKDKHNHRGTRTRTERISTGDLLVTRTTTEPSRTTTTTRLCLWKNDYRD